MLHLEELPAFPLPAHWTQIPWQCWCPSPGQEVSVKLPEISCPGDLVGKNKKGFLLKSRARLGMQGCISFLQAVAMTVDVRWVIAAPVAAAICTLIYPIRMCNQRHFMHKLAAQLCMPPAHVIVCLIGLEVLFTMYVLIFIVTWHRKQFRL